MDKFGALSYGIASIEFFVFAGLLATSWRGRIQGAYLILPVIVTAIWAAAVSFHVYHQVQILPLYILLAEVLKSSLWVLFVVRLLSSEQQSIFSGRARNFLFILAALLAAQLLVLIDISLKGAGYGAGQLVYVGFVSLSVLGIFLLEQLYRNTRPEKQWAIKYLCLGLGGVFAYDFYLFADALLFNQIDVSSWYVRGLAYAVLMPLIAIAVARNPQWSFELFVSRRIAFHTATLIAAGGYLLVMAAGGYYLSYFGGDWGRALQVFFLFAALLIFALILFSGQFRSYLHVFVNKHFFNYKYDYRDEWLRFTQTLADAPAGTVINESVLRALAEIVDSPAGILWVVEENKAYVPVAQVGLGDVSPPSLDKHDALINFISDTHWVINIDEYHISPDKYQGLMLPQWLLTIERTWLIVPLVEAGELFGLVLLAQSRAPRSFNWEDSDLLKTAGSQAAVFLAHYTASQALVDARQFEAFNQFSTFIIHDIKNMVAQLSLMVRNADKYKRNPEFVDDMIDTTRNAVEKMERLIAQLRTGKESYLHSGVIRVNLKDILLSVVEQKGSGVPPPELKAMPANDLFVDVEKDRMETIIGHLVQNAQDATPAEGVVAISCIAESDFARVTIRDTGSGMSESFIQNRLFRPFDSTKGSSGMGIGAYESREYILKSGGRLDVESEEGLGSSFHVILPLSRGIE